MIKNSYFNAELKKLKESCTPEAVFVARKCDFVLVKNFEPPRFYKKPSTGVLMEIPSGFGYGMNILNSFILLDRKFARHHLFQADVSPLFRDARHSMSDTGLKPGRKECWFWICFHMTDDDAYRESKTARPGGAEEITPRFMVGFVEFLNMLKVVLQAIADEDPRMIQELQTMNRNRDKILDERRRAIEEFDLSLNWRRLKWMY